MDRAGRKANQLSSDEMTLVFDLVDRGGGSEEARRLLGERGRDRSTASRLYNVVRELAARDLEALDAPTTLEIAEAARYSTTASFVQGVYLRWRFWKSRANACEDPIHQEFLRDRLGWLLLELKPLVRSFPEVFRLSYRPEDPGNRLQWTEEKGTARPAWSLAVEREPGWPLIDEHLATGLPVIFMAVNRARAGFAQYCEQLLVLEEDYRAAVGNLEVREGEKVKLNESHFYRSILGEVDQPDSTPSIEEYRHSAEDTGNNFVAFDGVVLITQAPDRGAAKEWVERHLRWREEMRGLHLLGLHSLREEIDSAVGTVIAGLEVLDQSGKVPGRCSRFSN